MKKQFDLVKFKKNRDVYCVKCRPTGFNLYGWMVCLILGAIIYDLELIFNIDLLHIRAVLGFLFIMSLTYCFCWVFSLFYYAIWTSYLIKKYPEFKEDFKYEDK